MIGLGCRKQTSTSLYLSCHKVSLLKQWLCYRLSSTDHGAGFLLDFRIVSHSFSLLNKENDSV